MDEKLIEIIFQILRRPIPWDPIPPWLRFNETQLKRFAEMELLFQAKYQELEVAKLKEFSKIAGIKGQAAAEAALARAAIATEARPAVAPPTDAPADASGVRRTAAWPVGLVNRVSIQDARHGRTAGLAL
jgi:hypothetical protein